jgi:hypothetical protein
VEDEESLKSGTVICKLSDSVKDEIDNLFSDGVVTTSVIWRKLIKRAHTVGGILLSGDELFRVEQLTVGTSSDLINHGGFKIDKDGTRDVLDKS